MSDVSFEVTISEMNAAKAKVTSENDNLRAAVDKMMKASDVLSQGWQGAANDDFRAVMAQRKEWFDMMVNTVDLFASALGTASARYQSADEEGAAMIRKF